MEDLIKRIEKYQEEQKKRYANAMEKPFNDIVYDFAEIIGSYQAMTEYIKQQLKNQ
jgi:hypothetical protein